MTVPPTASSPASPDPAVPDLAPPTQPGDLTPLPSSRTVFWQGVQGLAPLVPGVIPFGMVAGVAAVQAGFTPFQSAMFSVIGYAGSAQLVASQLFASGAPLALIFLSALVVNLRFAVYSASMLPVFRRLPTPPLWPLAYLLTDQAYAVSVTRPAGTPEPVAYYLGGSLLMWVTWQASTVAGALLGARIPASWPLDFAVPLSFVALLVPVLVTRPQLLAAAVSGLVATGLHTLPFRLNLMVGATFGVAAGLLLQRWAARGTPGAGQDPGAAP